MNAICFNCGADKAAPLIACHWCTQMPYNDNDVAVSLLLTQQHMSKEDLAASSAGIQSGNRYQLPVETQDALLAPLRRQVRPPPVAPAASRAWMAWSAAALAAALLFLLFHPWPHFQWASFQDTVPAYEQFVYRFSQSDLSGSAKERIRKLREEDVWSAAIRTGLISSLRDYARVYHDGKHLDEARALLRELADLAWRAMASSRSEDEIRRFLQDYPETSMVAAANARIQELHDDLTWVKEQNRLEYFQKFLARFPSHPERDWIEKQIIDLEVLAIAAGEYGEMPPVEPVSVGGPLVEVRVENQTGYELTILYSGAQSKKLVIAVNSKGALSLPPGDYKVAASVAAAHVTKYYGTETMQGGAFASNFYIRTSYDTGPSYSLPRGRSSGRRR